MQTICTPARGSISIPQTHSPPPNSFINSTSPASCLPARSSSLSSLHSTLCPASLCCLSPLQRSPSLCSHASAMPPAPLTASAMPGALPLTPVPGSRSAANPTLPGSRPTTAATPQRSRRLPPRHAHAQTDRRPPPQGPDEGGRHGGRGARATCCRGVVEWLQSGVKTGVRPKGGKAYKPFINPPVAPL